MPVTVPDVVISRRRTLYACCAADYSHQAILAHQRGDMECYLKHSRMMKYMLWARSIVDRTAMSTEDAGSHCVSHTMACAVINKADRFCINCGCPGSEQTVGPVPPSLPPCSLAADYTLEITSDSYTGNEGFTAVVDAADADLVWFLYEGTYLIEEDHSSFLGDDFSAGEIWSIDADSVATLVGTLGTGEMALDTHTSMLWQAGVNAPWPVFPVITAVINPTFTVTLASQSASEQVNGLRQVIIEYTTDGNTWLWLGGVSYPESAIAAGLTTLSNPAYAGIVGMRITYINGDCTYGPYPVSWNHTAQAVQLVIGTAKAAAGELNIYLGDIPGDPQPFTPAIEVASTSNDVDIVWWLSRVSGNNMIGGATGTGSFLFSDDSGASWTTASGVSPTASQYVQSIEPAKDGQHVFALRGSGGILDSLWKSDDYGETYSEIDITAINAVDQPVTVNAWGGQHILIGGRYNIWRSLNGGTTWTIVQTNVAAISHILVITGTESTAGGLVVVYDNTGVWRSLDKGGTWVYVGDYAAQTFDSDQAEAVIYTNTGWKSPDGGQSWFPMTLTSGGTAFTPLRVKVLTKNEVLILTNQKVFRTLNGGITWTEIYDHDSVGTEQTYSFEVTVI